MSISDESNSFHSERKLYELSGDRFAKRVVSCGDLSIAGTLDSTLEHIRGRIIGSQLRGGGMTWGRLSEFDADRDDDYKGSLFRRAVWEEPLQSQIHFYILMDGTGHSIRHFKDLPELVRVARDAMEGD